MTKDDQLDEREREEEETRKGKLGKVKTGTRGQGQRKSLRGGQKGKLKQGTGPKASVWVDNESEDNEDLSVEMELGHDSKEYTPGESRQMAAMM